MSETRKLKLNIEKYKCPICNAPLIEDFLSFGCSRYEGKGFGCQYRIFKEMFGIKLSEKDLDDLLTRGVTENAIYGFIDKSTGKTVSRRLYYNTRRNQVRFWYEHEDYLSRSKQQVKQEVEKGKNEV